MIMFPLGYLKAVFSLLYQHRVMLCNVFFDEERRDLQIPAVIVVQCLARSLIATRIRLESEHNSFFIREGNDSNYINSSLK